MEIFGTIGTLNSVFKPWNFLILTISQNMVRSSTLSEDPLYYTKGTTTTTTKLQTAACFIGSKQAPTTYTQKKLTAKQCNFQHFLPHLEVAQFHFSMEIHSRDCSLLKRGSKVLKIIIPEKFLPHQHHRRSQVYVL